MKRQYHILITGRVQGVCFRAYTKKTADALGLTGWVKNIPDGRVETVFEGDIQSVESMVAWCRQGPPLSAVDAVDIHEKPFSGHFENFRILY